MDRKFLSIAVLVQLMLLSAVPVIRGEEWITPFFTQPATQGVTFTLADGPNDHHQRMTVEEELPVPFTLAIINYKGNTAPTISRFYQDRNILSPKFERAADGNWLLVVDVRLDYETMDPNFSFEFSVTEDVNDGILPRISMTLLNIFDNAPRLDSPGACMIDELQDPFLTDCVYTLYDADGMEGNQHTFKVIGSNSEDELFEFVAGDRISLFEVEYRLRTKMMLLFEERELYSFTVNVTDAGGNEGSTRVIVEVDDLPNLPPKWTKSFVSDRFDEKQEREYLVVAIDGDTKINKTVFYALRFDDADKEQECELNICPLKKISNLTLILCISRDH